jgi:hypothetical protein
MARSQSQHGKIRKSRQVSTLAKSLAPEEIRAGDYVSVLLDVYEFPAIVWCDDTSLIDHNKIIHLPFVPRESSGEPLLVKAVCLPFVLVKHPCGKKRPLDVRNCRLARLDRTYAKTACKAYQENKPKKERPKRRKKKTC